MTDPRNSMTPLSAELQAIMSRLVENSCTEEETLQFEQERKELEKQARLRRAWQYLQDVGGDRIIEVLKDKSRWQETEAVKALRELQPGGCAFIQSEPGAGKTVAGLQYTGRMLVKGYSARYVTAATLTNDARDEGVLVIDEIGVEYVSTFWLTIFSQVLDFRYRHKLTTVLLTNLVLLDWAARYDTVEKGQELSGRIVSRIAQWSREPGGVFKEWCGKNLRLQQNTNP